MRVVVPLLLVALLAAACSDGDSTTREVQTAVAITLWPDGEGRGATKTVRVVCDPPSGTVPDSAAACATLASPVGRSALDPVPPDRMCTELYGGPAVARIVGTVAGESIDAQLSRVNGCEIERWETLSALLPAYLPV
jgi:hypothetical protein